MRNTHFWLTGVTSKVLGFAAACTTLMLAMAPANAACPVVTKARLLARSGQEGGLAKGRIVASNEGPTTGFKTLGEVKKAPAAGQWVEVELKNEEPYRWVKFESPNGSWANLAELEFYAGSKKLNAAAFGTNGSRDNSGNTFAKALDGDRSSFFEGVEPNGQYVGLDFGPENQAASPVFAPPPGSHDTPVEVKLTCPTAGSAIRSSLSSIPSRQKGNEYQRPIKVGKTSAIAAVAYADGLATSPVVFGVYRLGEKSDTQPVRSYHLGNSLTDTLNNMLQPVSVSLGKNHQFHRFTIPGAPTEWLWGHQESGFGESPAHVLSGVGVDHVCTQPFAGHSRAVKSEAFYSRSFFDMARSRNKDVQPWLYAQWPGPKFADRWAQGRWVKEDGPALFPNGPKGPASWQDGCRHHMAYHEALRNELNKTWPGKPVRIIPTPLVLAAVKDAVDAKKFDGMTDFLPDSFNDGIHLKSKAAYIVNLTVYACLFGESPEGETAIAAKVGYTSEQAKFLQSLVWKVVRNYPPGIAARP